jgi:hypothetical protein
MTYSLTTDWLFPFMTLTDATGQVHDAPGHFNGRTNLVVVAGHPFQSGQVESWLPWIDQYTAHHPGFHSYVMWEHHLENPPHVNGSGDLGPARTVRGDTQRVREALELTESDEITVMSVSRDGLVHGWVTGSFSDASGATLLEVLRTGA